MDSDVLIQPLTQVDVALVNARQGQQAGAILGPGAMAGVALSSSRQRQQADPGISGSGGGSGGGGGSGSHTGDYWPIEDRI